MLGRPPWTLTSAFRRVPRTPPPPPERRRRALASSPRERVRREWERDEPDWKCLGPGRGPAILLASYELVLRRAAPSLGRPRSLCFPRARPTLRRGGGNPSRHLRSRRLRRAATLEAAPPLVRGTAAAAAAGSSIGSAGGRDRGRQHGERLVPHFQSAGKNDIQWQGLQVRPKPDPKPTSGPISVARALTQALPHPLGRSRFLRFQKSPAHHCDPRSRQSPFLSHLVNPSPVPLFRLLPTGGPWPLLRSHCILCYFSSPRHNFWVPSRENWRNHPPKWGKELL